MRASIQGISFPDMRGIPLYALEVKITTTAVFCIVSERASSTLNYRQDTIGCGSCNRNKNRSHRVQKAS